MSAHTPGPWHFTQRLSGSENHNGYRVCCARWHTLATVTPLDKDGEEGEANARLIAAAPALLEALMACRGQWIHSVNAAQCKAAIAKATGEAA